MLRITTVLFLASLSLLTACSSIRVVQKTKEGGVLALKGPRDSAHEKAEEYMLSRCPEGYDVLEEGEAVVGQDTSVRTEQTRYGTSTSTAQTRDVREWRIVYRCTTDASAAARVVVVGM